MFWKRKRKLVVKVFITIFSFALAAAGFAAEFNSARILPLGKVSIYKGDRKVGEFTKEAPLPEGSLLACDGRCGVKMNDLFLVGEDKSMFSVEANNLSQELAVKKGTVYFALSKLPRTLEFITPAGVVTTRQVLLNASTDGNLLKGYVSVKPEASEIGVIEGGAMIVSTSEGEKKIQTGKAIRLAMADSNQTNSGAVKTNPTEGFETTFHPTISEIGVATGITAAGAGIGYGLSKMDGIWTDGSPTNP